MERVSGDGFFSYRREIRRKDENKRARGASATDRDFSEVAAETEFAASVDAVSEDEAAALLDAVFSVGDRLKRSQDAQTFAEYRQAVRSFLSAVVGGGIAIEERTSGSSVQRRKRYSLIQVIDAKLEQLAAGMISSQRQQLDLLAKVDEINGLLVDLRH